MSTQQPEVIWEDDGGPEFPLLPSTPPRDDPATTTLPLRSSIPSSPTLIVHSTPTFLIPPVLETPPTPTLSTLSQTFTSILRLALGLNLSSMARYPGVHLRIGTLCSGTDAPIFALMELREAAAGMGCGGFLSWEHAFSAEIEEFKQAFIRRNVGPRGAVFRNVLEMARFPEAMNAEGFLEPVDEHVDLLVFGSSCVDFSNLNNSKKALAKGTKINVISADYRNPEPDINAYLEDLLNTVDGESSRTFLAGLLYISKYRPAVVIMENVINAPWDEISDFWFAKVGYKARYVKVNTKDYGIPHIRMRGYLVAIDAAVLSKEGDAERFTTAWETAMSQLIIDDPAPLSSFILQPGDPRLLHHRNALKKNVRSIRINDARMCQLRHAEARVSEGLPAGSRYTMMDERGHCTPRDDSFMEAIEELGEREKDLLDITYERGLLKNYDLVHKLQIYDISQNVDRSPGQLGLTPCLTPKGNPFVTNQGRPLLGLEALGLQGIDMDRIVPSIETQPQLQDLAGNAMTTTVIGAAILSVLSAYVATLGSVPLRPAKPFAEAFVQEQLREKNAVATASEAVLRDLLSLGERRPRQLDGLTGEQLQAFFEENRVWCPCEGGYTRDRGEVLWICKACREVRCSVCKGNPKHWFERLTVSRPVVDMPQAVLEAKMRANAVITLVPEGEQSVAYGECRVVVPDLETLRLEKYPVTVGHQALLNLVRGNVRYVFTSVHVGQDITFFYTSRNATLRIITSNRSITWLIYLNPSSWTVRRHEKLHNPSQPFIRAIVQPPAISGIPVPDNWSLWISSRLGMWFRGTRGTVNGLPALKVTPEEPAVVLNPEGKEGPWHEMFSGQLHDLLDMVAGTYLYSDLCGTPHGRLFTKMSTVRGYRLYIFEDSGLVSDPADDSVVLATSCRRLQPFETREVAAVFPRWSWDINGKLWVECHGWWSRHTHVPNLDDARGPLSVTLPKVMSLDTTAWWPAPSMAVQVHGDVLMAVSSTTFQARAHASAPFVTMNLPLNSPWPSGLLSVLLHPYSDLSKKAADATGWILLPERMHSDVFKLLFHIFKSITPSVLRGLLIAPDTSTADLRRATGLCQHCTPIPPSVHQVTNRDGRVIELVSDQGDCYRFEMTLQQRPAVLSLQLLPSVDETVKFRISLNVETLIHRAMGYLPIAKYALPKIHTSIVHTCGNIETWHSPQNMRNLRPFISEVLPTGPVETGARVLQSQPPSFVRNGKELRLDQMDALEWMLSLRGRTPEPFREQEVEEFLVPELELRVTGTVGRDNFAAGAVLAHEVGYGKTVVSLALLDYQQDDIAGSLESRRLSVPERPFIHLKASLVIVPHHLVKQWTSEIDTFLQHKDSPWVVHVINSKADALTLNRKALEKADIVVASFRAIQFTQARMDLLAAVGGQFRLSDKEGGRKLGDWYDGVVSWLRPPASSNIDDPRDLDIDKETLDRREEVRRVIAAAQKSQVPKSSRKGTGRAKDDVFDPSLKPLEAQGKPSTLWQRGAALEMYSFSSIIYDEFSYSEPHIALFVSRALATSKWILSGTPPLAHLGQICEMSTLLNIHVAREEPAVPLHLPKITQGPSTKDMSSAERFRSYRQLKSAQFVATRDATARSFLRQLTRRNAAIQGDYRLTEIVVPVTMNSVASVLYHVAQQTLFDAKWVFDDVQGDLREMVAQIAGVGGQGRPAVLGTKRYLTAAAEALMMCASGRVTELMQQMATPTVKLRFSEEKRGLSMGELLGNLLMQQEEQLRALEKPLKSQWDRMMYLSERVSRDPEFDMEKAAGTDARRGKQRSAMTLRDSLVEMVFPEGGEKEMDEGMRELRKVIVPNGEAFRKSGMESQLRQGDCRRWAEHEGGPGRFHIADWYADVETALSHISFPSPEVSYLFHDAATAVSSQLDYATFLASPNPRESLLSLMDSARRSCPFIYTSSLDHRLGFASLDKELTLLFHRCRSIGLKATVTDTVATLRDRLSRFTSGTCREADFEFQSALPAALPYYGQTKTTRGAGIDAGLDDFILSVQSVDLGIRNHWVPAWQRLRLIRATLELLELGGHSGEGVKKRKPKMERLCDVCGSVITGITEAALLVTCGHVYCSVCSALHASTCRCLVPTCRCTARSALMSADHLLPTPKDTTISSSAPSPKVSRILILVQEIIARGESVLIFVQAEALKEQLASSLSASRIPFGRTDGKSGAEVLERFQRGNFPVLLQGLMSTESAGSNLTRANHVIIAAPLMTDRESWGMYMRQAVGRCNRPGQCRDVWVYHFVTKWTVEVDVLEGRLRERLMLGTGGWILGGEVMGMEKDEMGCFGLESLGMGRVEERGRVRAMFDEREIGRLLGGFDDETMEE